MGYLGTYSLKRGEKAGSGDGEANPWALISEDKAAMSPGGSPCSTLPSQDPDPPNNLPVGLAGP